MILLRLLHRYGLLRLRRDLLLILGRSLLIGLLLVRLLIAWTCSPVRKPARASPFKTA